MPRRASRPTQYVSHAAIWASDSSSSGGASPKPPCSRSRTRSSTRPSDVAVAVSLCWRGRLVSSNAPLSARTTIAVADSRRGSRGERRRLVDLDVEVAVGEAERRQQLLGDALDQRASKSTKLNVCGVTVTAHDASRHDARRAALADDTALRSLSAARLTSAISSTSVSVKPASSRKRRARPIGDSSLSLRVPP